VPAKLRALGIRPSKRLGQNFLCDPRVAERIAAAIEDPAEPVVEIGPGLGALSLHLASTGRPFVAVELDLRLADTMENELKAFPRARVVRGDILDQRVDALMPQPERVTVVGNLPYSITTPALEWILGQGSRVRRAILMVQREYAERLTAEPGTKEYGTVTVYVGLNASVRRLFRVSPGAFYPRPQVDSVVLEVVPRAYPGASAEERAAASRLARASMGSRRKTLANALARGLSLPAAEARALLDGAGLDPGRRGETLSLAELLGLAREWIRGGCPEGAK
jgi:16S rRNA (adenine1518-N6/adenine1519-N6)-dimethyltransferase